jgi:hypothetical protein
MTTRTSSYQKEEVFCTRQFERLAGTLIILQVGTKQWQRVVWRFEGYAD